MEGLTAKRTKNRKRKRPAKKQRRGQVKFDVRYAKHQKLVSERRNVFVAKEKIISSTMQANSFWENYSTALEWQKSHSIIWWKTRCCALEQENQILRDKIRDLAGQSSAPNTWIHNLDCVNVENNKECEENDVNSEDEGLEFQVDEEMMTFLEQSLKHKQELKKRREIEANTGENDEGGITFENAAEMVRIRKEAAKLLYGEASSKILAMETALEATMDRHKTRAKPQYWPNIPFKP